MKLREDVNLLSLVKQVKQCKNDVILVTREGDRLNLNSTLSQYVCIALVTRPELLLDSRLECSDADYEILKEFEKKD